MCRAQYTTFGLLKMRIDYEDVLFFVLFYDQSTLTKISSKFGIAEKPRASLNLFNGNPWGDKLLIWFQLIMLFDWRYLPVISSLFQWVLTQPPATFSSSSAVPPPFERLFFLLAASLTTVKSKSVERVTNIINWVFMRTRLELFDNCKS